MRTWADYKKTMSFENVVFSLARSGDLASLREFGLTGDALNEKNTQGYSLLMLAVYNGNRDTARYLLTQGADPNTADNQGSTALMGAAFKGELALISLLCEFGANAAMKNFKGQSALDFAMMFEQAPVVQFLRSLNH